MRHLSLLLIPALAFGANEKLTPEQRMELIRGLSAEYATVKLMLPRSKKALEYDLNGKSHKDQWDEAARERGPAARAGDLVQITKVDLDNDKITFEINGGLKSGRKWYDNVSVGMSGTNGRPVANGPSGTATLGTTLVVKFPKGVPAVDTAEMKKLLKPLFDFDQHSATEAYVDSLPPETKKAITEKRVIEGMDKDQVLLAIGKPRLKSRESNDGVETEDWVYGQAPGKITFLTFQSSKVIKIRESYAGLGGQTVSGPKPVIP
ncbi:DUF2845 domain-containing protein [Bryobacter aggregatus]|uniref:DUF2845 domain-containing protein n=1 Tax=Bryobacter aggregatus TaxID=360054 RepID=UPI001EE2BA45|nr:DUF2845 domain-containing protein [Bryobacter aggregatus]